MANPPFVRNPEKAKPLVIIPVFPGTSCEYDVERSFLRAGANVQQVLFCNLDQKQIRESVSRLADALRRAQILALPGGFSSEDELGGSVEFITSVFRNSDIADATMNLLTERDGLILGIGNGFQCLVKLGLLPYGEICERDADDLTLTFNTIGRYVSSYVCTRVQTTRSPWLRAETKGSLHRIPVSHGQGRFIASCDVLRELQEKDQIAFQYVNLKGQTTLDEPWNPSGSFLAVEGLISPDGHVLGKMGHSERAALHVARNIPGEKQQTIFASGVSWFSDLS